MAPALQAHLLIEFWRRYEAFADCLSLVQYVFMMHLDFLKYFSCEHNMQ